MAKTTLYTITSDAELVEFATYEGLSTGARAVWGLLAPKYVSGVASQRSGSVGRDVMTDEKVLPEVVNAAARMSDADKFALLTTTDFVAILVADLPALADHLDTFIRENAAEFDGRALHISTQAEDLRRVISEAGDKGWVGVCWDQTSCCPDLKNQSITTASADPAAVFGVLASRSPAAVARVRAME